VTRTTGMRPGCGGHQPPTSRPSRPGSGSGNRPTRWHRRCAQLPTSLVVESRAVRSSGETLDQVDVDGTRRHARPRYASLMRIGMWPRGAVGSTSARALQACTWMSGCSPRSVNRPTSPDSMGSGPAVRWPPSAGGPRSSLVSTCAHCRNRTLPPRQRISQFDLWGSMLPWRTCGYQPPWVGTVIRGEPFRMPARAVLAGGGGGGESSCQVTAQAKARVPARRARRAVLRSLREDAPAGAGASSRADRSARDRPASCALEVGRHGAGPAEGRVRTEVGRDPVGRRCLRGCELRRQHLGLGR
jgi:hypothetical protein